MSLSYFSYHRLFRSLLYQTIDLIQWINCILTNGTRKSQKFVSNRRMRQIYEGVRTNVIIERRGDGELVFGTIRF